MTRRGWNHDEYRTPLPPEQPGPPEPGGVWETARELVAAYDFSPPEILHALYDPAEPLEGRHLLLEGRFSALRLLMGVRVTEVVDELHEDGRRVWAWGYETLTGHLERGKITYAVVKHQVTGAVEFVITAYSQRSRSVGPVLSLGWAVFGRRTQLRFYERCGERVPMLTLQRLRAGTPERLRTPEGLVRAPADAEPTVVDRIAVRRTLPG